MWRSWIILTVTVLPACRNESATLPAMVQVDSATVLVPSASETLGQPVDVALDDAGNIYVLDRIRAQILVFAPSGVLLDTIGREGSGPREFRSPQTLVVTPDTIRVVDIGNGVLKSLARHSDFERRTSLPAGTGASRLAVSRDGGLLGSTMGAREVLAVFQDPAGQEVGTLGHTELPMTIALNLVQLKRDIIAGKLPAIVQYATLPVFAPNGEMWLILTGQGIVQRYERDGSLLWAVPFAMPEKVAIWSACVAWNREFLNDQWSICLPAYAADAVAEGGMLWVLLNMPEGEPSVIVGFDSTGRIVQRIRFQQVKGARQFALDRARGRVVFAICSDASVVMATFPFGVSK